MNRSLYIGFGIIAVFMVFAVVATIPGINLPSTVGQQVYASDGGNDKECLSASSALFFDTQSELAASV